MADYPPAYKPARKFKWVRLAIAAYMAFNYVMECAFTLMSGPHVAKLWEGGFGVLYAVLFVSFL